MIQIGEVASASSSLLIYPLSQIVKIAIWRESKLVFAYHHVETPKTAGIVCKCVAGSQHRG